MAMTLEQVRDWAAKTPASNGWQAKERDDAVAALSAHLTQPAQAVDVDAVRAVIEQTREYYERTDDRRTAYALENVLSDIYETLTAALPNANGKEG